MDGENLEVHQKYASIKSQGLKNLGQKLESPDNSFTNSGFVFTAKTIFREYLRLCKNVALRKFDEKKRSTSAPLMQKL